MHRYAGHRRVLPEGMGSRGPRLQSRGYVTGARAGPIAGQVGPVCQSLQSQSGFHKALLMVRLFAARAQRDTRDCVEGPHKWGRRHFHGQMWPRVGPESMGARRVCGASSDAGARKRAVRARIW